MSGHYHHENGPRRYGRTLSYALAELVYPKANRRRPERANPDQRVIAGSIGVLDTRAQSFEFVRDGWLADVCGDRIDLAELVGEALS